MVFGVAGGRPRRFGCAKEADGALSSAFVETSLSVVLWEGVSVSFCLADGTRADGFFNNSRFVEVGWTTRGLIDGVLTNTVLVMADLTSGVNATDLLPEDPRLKTLSAVDTTALAGILGGFGISIGGRPGLLGFVPWGILGGADFRPFSSFMSVTVDREIVALAGVAARVLTLDGFVAFAFLVRLGVIAAP